MVCLGEKPYAIFNSMELAAEAFPTAPNITTPSTKHREMVKTNAFLEQGFIHGGSRDAEMLPGTREIDKSKIDHLDVLPHC